ncbi:trypsin-like serine peptidase [Streptomonospora salina]|uniref:V8-like Glu-specific endopeptidase n=1 Tax=Streptomonospora salina TaxID=104205 RepID=A0A841EH02_9ACTN|nr:trypsin-like serine protease [Streptomonospora salina]MBB5999670.1 V8-like Glu-specific endopeptidase [Streptomonospora salina]
MRSPASRKLIASLLGAVTALTGSADTQPAQDHADQGGGGGASTAAVAPSPEPAQDRTAPVERAPGFVRQAAAVGDDERRAVLDYWTPRRMAGATPLIPGLDDLAGGVLPDAPEPQASGDAGAARPWTGGGRVAATTGKVFLTLDGRDFTCSAAVVSADNRDTVLTAGHCLKDGTGPWVENWSFVPGYDDGESPDGRYTARQMFVAPEWSQQADDSYDFGMAVLNPSDGEHVQDRVGAQPIAFGAEPDDPTYAFGYPATGRFEGRRLRYCTGDTVGDDGGTTAEGMACAMTEGSSGGPWLNDFDPETGTGTVVSVISFKYADDSRTQYGPHLGGAAETLFERAQSF